MGEEALGVPARATVNLHFNEYVDPDALLGAIGTTVDPIEGYQMPSTTTPLQELQASSTLFRCSTAC